MKTDSLDRTYKFLKEINKFKSVDRLSLITENGRRESDAEHTWHLIMAAWLYSDFYEKPIDMLKIFKLALVHDLVEIYAGDVYGGANNSERLGKEDREKEAAIKLFEQLPKDKTLEFMELWNEYEDKKTNEAEYVWALDKISPRFQLTITKKDLAENLPTDTLKSDAQEKRINEISKSLGEILKKIYKDRG